MPELPEVEATRVLLSATTSGRRIVAIHGEPQAALAEALTGRVIGPWRRVGKQLAATTEDGHHLALHLGMTGKILVNPAPDRRFVRVSLELDDGTHVAFVDTRRLGAMRHLAADVDPFAALGPDALVVVRDATSPGAALAACLGPRGGTGGRVALKDRALDQRRIAGIGNIAIIEGCHRADIHPHAPTESVSDAGWSALAAGLREHLEATLEACLASAEVLYVSEGGPNPFRIYGRGGATCPRCNAAPIARLSRAGRPTFVCPACQPLPP